MSRKRFVHQYLCKFINNNQKLGGKTLKFPSTGEWIVGLYPHNRIYTIKKKSTHLYWVPKILCWEGGVQSRQLLILSNSSAMPPGPMLFLSLCSTPLTILSFILLVTDGCYSSRHHIPVKGRRKGFGQHQLHLSSSHQSSTSQFSLLAFLQSAGSRSHSNLYESQKRELSILI